MLVQIVILTARLASMQAVMQYLTTVENNNSKAKKPEKKPQYTVRHIEK